MFLAVLLISGCGKNNGRESGSISEESVQETSLPETVITESAAVETAVPETAVPETAATETAVMETETVQENSGVDYDLTEMDSDMVYVMVYQLMIDPDQYIGKTFRISGSFRAIYSDQTKKWYSYCLVQDALACCAQGVEFVWGDGTHIYPDEYPLEDTRIVVEGTFETYQEEGSDSLYSRLADATMRIEI